MSTAVFGQIVPRSAGRTARRGPLGLCMALVLLATIAAPALVRADDQDEGQKIFGAMKPSVVSIFNLEGSGTGVLMNADGLILTCAHVVTSPIPYQVKVDIGTADEPKIVIFKKVEIVGYHPEKDLAEIKIDPKENNVTLVPAPFSKDKAATGQRIYAIGDPGAGDKILEKTITQGIVSGVDREFDQQKFYQIDAAINPGNSGGPVVDHNGKVLGIVDFVFQDKQALNFCIPVRDIDFNKFVPLTEHKANPSRSAELLKYAKEFSEMAQAALRDQGADSEEYKKYTYYAFYCFSESLIYDPSNPEIYTDIGMQYNSLNANELASAYLVRAVELRPWGVNNSITYNALGFSWSQQKMEDKAITSWKEGLAKFPYTASLWDAVATYDMDKEQYADAAYSASVALACTPPKKRITALQRMVRDARGHMDEDERADLSKKIDHDAICEALDKMRVKSNKARKRRDLYMTTAFVDLMKEVGTLDVPGVEDKISQVPLRAPDDLAIGEEVADADADPDAPAKPKKHIAAADDDGGDDIPAPIPHKHSIVPPDGPDDGPGNDVPTPKKKKPADPDNADPDNADPGDTDPAPAPHKKTAKPDDSDDGSSDPDETPKNKAKAADPKGGDDWLGGKKGDSPKAGAEGSGDDKAAAPSTVIAPTPAVTGLDLAGKVVTVDDARVAPIDVDGQEISDAVFAADGSFVFVLQKNGLLRKIAVPTLKEERQTNLANGVVAIGMTRKGLAVYMSTAGEVWLLDPNTLEVKHRTAVPGVVRMATVAGSSNLLVSTGPTNLQLVDPVGGKILAKLTPTSAEAGPGLTFDLFALSPDGKNFFANQSGSLCQFSITAGQIAYVATGPKLGTDPQKIIVSPDSRYVCMPCKSGNTPVAGEPKKDFATYVFKVTALQTPVMTIESGASPSELAFDVPARQIYAQNNQRQLIVFSPSGDKIKDYSLTKDKTPDTVKFLVHPDGRSLLVLVGGTLQWVTLP